MANWQNAYQRAGLGARLNALLRDSRTVYSDKPEVVGQIMTREVRVSSAALGAVTWC